MSSSEVREEETEASESSSVQHVVIGCAAALSPIGIWIGSAIPLSLLGLLFIITLMSLVGLLSARSKHSKRKPSTEEAATDKEKQEVDLVESEREATWTGEYRYRNEPGVFYGEAVKKIVRALVLTDEEKAVRKDLLHRVTAIVHSAFPGSAATSAPEGSGASISLCGSNAAKVCIRGRNLDLCLRIVEELGSEESVADALCKALWEEDMEDVSVRTRGGRQIVRFTDPETAVIVDMGINVHQARLAASLVKEYASISKRALQLIVVVKHWADRRDICSSFSNGTLNSYGFTLLVISFLQRRMLPVVPVFPCDRLGCSKSRSASFGGTRSGFLEMAKANEEAHESMRERVAELLIAFFDFYGNDFDPKKQIVSVRTGELLRKKGQQRLIPLYIEDPIVPDWNVAASVDNEGLHRIRKECRRAKRLLTETPASKRLWKRFLSPPNGPFSSAVDMRLSASDEGEHQCEDSDDCLECRDCSECAQLKRS